jgi:hypothetical protein
MVLGEETNRIQLPALKAASPFTKREEPLTRETKASRANLRNERHPHVRPNQAAVKTLTKAVNLIKVRCPMSITVNQAAIQRPADD